MEEGMNDVEELEVIEERVSGEEMGMRVIKVRVRWVVGRVGRG